MDKPAIALLLGGTSPEREVSKSTAVSVFKALKNLDYKVTLIDPAYGTDQPRNEKDFFSKKDHTIISNKNYGKTVNSDLFDKIDLAFLALHGKWGEDGTIQSLLELRDVKYTGSKVLSSAISIDKIMSKILFRHFDIQTPEWISVDKNNREETIEMINKSFAFPCVIKPNDQGSTVGLTICKNENEVYDGVMLALKFSQKALIEEYIPGREMTVTVLESEALPVLEIKPKHELYDYECKYTAGMSEHIVPADIPEEISDNLKSEALKAFNSLGCEVYSRVDFRLSNDLKIYCLEVNTLPGMTSTSLVPEMVQAAGITFEQLIEKIINLSLNSPPAVKASSKRKNHG